MANPGRAALGNSGKLAPDPAPRLNGPAKAMSPVASPIPGSTSPLPPPLTPDQVQSYKTDAKPGPVIVMPPGVRAATAAGRSGSPVPARPPPQPPSTTSPTPSPVTGSANGKISPTGVAPTPVSPTAKPRPQSAIPMSAVQQPSKPQSMMAQQPPPPPPPVSPAPGKSVIVFKRPKNGAVVSSVPLPSPPPPQPTTTTASPTSNKMRVSDVPLPPRTTYDGRPYSVSSQGDFDDQQQQQPAVVSPRRNAARSVDGGSQLAARDAMQQAYLQKIVAAKDATDQELHAFVAEVAAFQDFTRSIILQELNQAARRFLNAPPKQLLHGGCRRYVQDIISFLRQTKEGGAVLSKVEERATSKLLLVIMKFSRIIGAFESEKEPEEPPQQAAPQPPKATPTAPTPQPPPAVAPVATRPTPSTATRGMHAPIPPPPSVSPTPSPPPAANPPPAAAMEEIVICRICERKIPASERARHTETCSFRTQAEPRIAYCNESMVKCLAAVAHMFKTAIAQQTATQPGGQKLTLKICWLSEATGDITLTKMISPDSTEPVLTVLHKVLSVPGVATGDGNSVVHLNEWGLYVPRAGIWLDERLNIGSYDLRDKEQIYFKRRPREHSNRPKSMAGSRLSTLNASSAVSSISNHEFIDTIKSLIRSAVEISMTKTEKPDEEMTKVFRFFQQVRTQNVLYKTRCAKEDREILDRMKEKVDIITKLVELKKSSRRKSIYEPPTGRHSIADFDIVKPISRGAFGQVFLARKKATGDIFAIKAIKKSEAVGKNQASKNHLAIERNILTFANNTCVVKLYYTFQSKNYLYMVMEYLPGGDLFSLLRNMNVFEEDWARKYCAEIVLALEYLHGNNIIHRDLKPDNVLISRSGHIKLTDFGLSEMGLKDNIDSTMGAFMEPVEEEERETAKGSPEYLAPEILLGNGSSFTADWWALGVMLYEFLVGITPFYADTIDDVFQNVLAHQGEVKWPEAPDQDISEEAMDLVSQLLNPNPTLRLGANGAAEVKAHPFFASINWDKLLQEAGPMVPKVDDTFSTEYFEARNDLYKVDYVINIDEETRDEVKDQRMRRWTGVNFANLKELTLGQG